MYRMGRLRTNVSEGTVNVWFYLGFAMVLAPGIELLFGIFGVTALRERLSIPTLSIPWARIPDWQPWTWSVVGIGWMAASGFLRIVQILEELQRLNLAVGNILKDPDGEFSEPSHQTLQALRRRLLGEKAEY